MRLTQGRQLPGIFCNLQWSRLHLGPQQDPPSTQLPDTASRLVLASVRTGDVTPVIILQMREPGSQNPGARPGSLVRAVGGLLQWGGSPGWKPSAPRSHFHYNSGRSTPNTALPAPWRLPDSPLLTWTTEDRVSDGGKLLCVWCARPSHSSCCSQFSPWLE